MIPGAAALGAALGADSGDFQYLTNLGVNGNHIGDEGVTALAAALATGATRIKSLGLANNEIGDEGAIALAEACAKTKAVRAAQGRLSTLRVLLCKSVLYGDFVWARRVLKHQKRRFPARAGVLAAPRSAPSQQ
jgi:hypothetical protein